MDKQVLEGQPDVWNNKKIIVQSRKYDGDLHREWEARLVQRNGALIVLEGEFTHDIHHPLLGLIQEGTRSSEYFWTDRWYSIFRFSHPNGEFRNFYCNVNTPAIFKLPLLTFVDLDIDVIVDKNLLYRVVDTDEFELNATKFDYSNEVREAAEKGVKELISMIEHCEYPFDDRQ